MMLDTVISNHTSHSGILWTFLNFCQNQLAPSRHSYSGDRWRGWPPSIRTYQQIYHSTSLHFTSLHFTHLILDMIFFFDCILHRIILVYILHAWRTSTHKYQLPPICLLCACHIVYIAMSFFFLFYFWNVFDMKCIHYDSCQGSRVVQRMRGSRAIERNCAKTNRNIRRVKENEKTKTGEAKNNDWQSANEWIE